MNEAVSDVIAARARGADQLTRTLYWSLGAHIALLALVLMAPAPGTDVAPQEVMMISLGGAEGPRTQGLTQMGGRAVQAPTPDEPIRRAESAPAPIQPPLTIPQPQARPERPRPRPETAPREATSRTPTTGPQPREGSTRTETQVRGQGFGLSSGGGGGGGIQLDSNFCCPEYITTMVDLIRRNWNQGHGIVATTTMRFRILRNGTIEDIQVEKSSGFAVLDQEAQRALFLTRLPPLPPAYTNPTLGVHMQFDYTR